jgi:hypothetical protein
MDALGLNFGRYSRILRYGGCRYFITEEMSAMFLKHVHDLVESGETQLVPVPHAEGIDLLLIGPGTVFTIAPVETRPDSTVTGIRLEAAARRNAPVRSYRHARSGGARAL